MASIGAEIHSVCLGDSSSQLSQGFYRFCQPAMAMHVCMCLCVCVCVPCINDFVHLTWRSLENHSAITRGREIERDEKTENENVS